MKILVINGPNLNLLGKREAIYGSTTYEELVEKIREWAAQRGMEVEVVQYNGEGDLIDQVQRASEFSGLIINPGGLTHYSVALRDALAACSCPKVEVHLTNIFAREEYRRRTVTGEAVDVVIAGAGAAAYRLALDWLQKREDR